MPCAPCRSRGSARLARLRSPGPATCQAKVRGGQPVVVDGHPDLADDLRYLLGSNGLGFLLKLFDLGLNLGQ